MLKRHWFSANFFLSVTFSVLSAALSVVFALLLMNMVDAAISEDFSALVSYLLLAVAAFVTEPILNSLAIYFSLRYVRHNLIKSKNALFSDTVKGFLNHKDINIANFSTDTDILYSTFYRNHTLVFRAAAVLVFSVVGIIFIHWAMLLVVLAASALAMVAPAIFKKRLQKSVADYSKDSNKYLDFVKDTTEGIFEVKSFGAQGFFKSLHEKLNTSAENSRLRNMMFLNLLNITGSFFGSFVFLAIIGVGGFFSIEGLITIGALIAVIQLLNGIVGSMARYLPTLAR